MVRFYLFLWGRLRMWRQIVQMLKLYVFWLILWGWEKFAKSKRRRLRTWLNSAPTLSVWNVGCNNVHLNSNIILFHQQYLWNLEIFFPTQWLVTPIEDHQLMMPINFFDKHWFKKYKEYSQLGTHSNECFSFTYMRMGDKTNMRNSRREIKIFICRIKYVWK